MDTQNKAWAADKSKFGYRMLEKMGWKEGQGLGVKADGIKSHIRVKRKRCNGGVGTEGRNEAVWRVPGEVSTGFNDVLSRIAANGGDGDAAAGSDGAAVPVAAAPAEATAPNGAVKGRRSYFGRRSRQKNVSEYSEAQLREIFGGAAIVPVARTPVVLSKTVEGRVKKKEKRTRKDKKSKKAKKKKDGSLKKSRETKVDAVVA